MKIRTKLLITFAVSIGTAVAVGIALFLSLQSLNREQNHTALLQALIKEEAELRSATFEYLTHHEQWMYLQWKSKYELISRMLRDVTADGDREKTVLEDVRQNHKSVANVFALLTAESQEIRKENAATAGAREANLLSLREKETILGGQLLLRSQAVFSDLFRLAAWSRKDMADAQKRMMLAVVLSILVLLFVITAASFTIMKALLKPIDDLKRGTGIVGAGNLDFRIGTDREDEIGQLSRSFDRMAEQLKEQTDQLESVNRELEAFSYSVSHDLRAPLRHISGYIDLLKRKTSASLDEKGRHYVEMITESGAKMGDLIDDLLAFSRMGRMEMHLRKVDLAKLLREVMDEFREETRGRKILWEVDPLPDVEGDPSMLRLVLTNLVSNAVKFTRTRAEARIRIGWEEGEPGMVKIFVRDNGVGFDMKYADKLFGVFQRLHSTAEYDGTGVGLANVLRIVHRHGGETWGEGAVNEGAMFCFTIKKHEGRVA